MNTPIKLEIHGTIKNCITASSVKYITQFMGFLRFPSHYHASSCWYDFF